MTDTFTELLPAPQQYQLGFTYKVRTLENLDSHCTVICSSSYIAKELLEKHFKGCTFSLRSISATLLQHSGFIVVDVESKLISVEDEHTVVESEVKLSGETNEAS